MPGQETDEAVSEKLIDIAKEIKEYKTYDTTSSSSYLRKNAEKNFYSKLYSIHPAYLNTVFEKTYDKLDDIVQLGETLLMSAVRANNIQFVKAIIEYAEKGHIVVVNFISDSKSNTPLSLAILVFNSEMTKMLIDNGADVNQHPVTEALKTITNVVDMYKTKWNTAVTFFAKESFKDQYHKYNKKLQEINEHINKQKVTVNGGTKANYVSTKKKITFTSNGGKVSRVVYVNVRGTKYVKHAGAMVLVSKLKNVSST